MEGLFEQNITGDQSLDVVASSVPRFDETTVQKARPVVPLTEEAISTTHSLKEERGFHSTVSRKKLWALLSVAALIITFVVMVAGITTYRRNHIATTQSSVQPAEATDSQAQQAATIKESSSASAVPTAQKTKRRVGIMRSAQRTFYAAPQIVSPVPETSGAQKARLVSRYVIHR